jgi:hypothetical protein
MGLLSVTALGIFFEIDVLGLSYIHLYKWIWNCTQHLWLVAVSDYDCLFVTVLWFSATLWFCRVFPRLYLFPAQCLSLKAC